MTIAERDRMASTLQHRSFGMSAVSVDDGFTFDGIASVVDKPYTVRDQFGEFTETISEGAFNRALDGSTSFNGNPEDVFLFVNHRHADVPMARNTAGTLSLTATPDLRAVAQLDPARPDVQIARSAINRGELNQMSIGFTVNKNRDSWNEDFTERVIKEVNLREVSIVAIGANPFTSATMRSFDEWMDSLADLELELAEIERAIGYFTQLRPIPEINPAILARDRADMDRLLAKAAGRLAIPA